MLHLIPYVHQGAVRRLSAEFPQQNRTWLLHAVHIVSNKSAILYHSIIFNNYMTALCGRTSQHNMANPIVKAIWETDILARCRLDLQVQPCSEPRTGQFSRDSCYNLYLISPCVLMRSASAWQRKEKRRGDLNWIGGKLTQIVHWYSFSRVPSVIPTLFFPYRCWNEGINCQFLLKINFFFPHNRKFSFWSPILSKTCSRKETCETDIQVGTVLVLLSRPRGPPGVSPTFFWPLKAVIFSSAI